MTHIKKVITGAYFFSFKGRSLMRILSSPTPLGKLTIHTLIVENVHDPQLMFPGHICYLASHFDDNFLRND